MIYKIVFFGNGEFAAIILEKLAKSDYKPTVVVTQPAKPVGRHQFITPSPAKKIAEKHNIAVYELKTLKNKGTEKLIKSFEPDLIVVADYGKIIPKNILAIPKFSFLNIHPSLLPKHRGPSPIQYTILNNDEETGVTIIKMDEQVDHGPIVAVSDFRFPIFDLTYSELLKKLAEMGSDLLMKTLPRWLGGKIKPIPQDEARATYTKILTREDGKIDWQKSAEEIERQIRAFEKWPTSWCEWKENDKKRRLKILKAKILHPVTGCAKNQTSGFVFLTEQKEMAINCNPGSLVIKELQLEGRKKTSGKEFLMGYPKIISTVLF